MICYLVCLQVFEPFQGLNTIPAIAPMAISVDVTDTSLSLTQLDFFDP